MRSPRSRRCWSRPAAWRRGTRPAWDGAKRWPTPSLAMAWQSRTGLATTAIWCAATALPCCSCRKAWNGIGAGHRLVVGIAAQSDTHITLLRRLTRLIQDEATLQRLFATTDAGEIVNALTGDIAITTTQVPATDLAERFDWTIAYPSGLHARPATRWAETARRLRPAPRCVPATRQRTPRVWSRCCNLACVMAMPSACLPMGRMPALLTALRRGHGGPGGTGKGRRRSTTQGHAGGQAGIRPRHRLPSSASVPALGWQSARCMLAKHAGRGRRSPGPARRRRGASAGRASHVPASSWPRCRMTPAPAWRLGRRHLQGPCRAVGRHRPDYPYLPADGRRPWRRMVLAPGHRTHRLGPGRAGQLGAGRARRRPA